MSSTPEPKPSALAKLQGAVKKVVEAGSMEQALEAMGRKDGTNEKKSDQVLQVVKLRGEDAVRRCEAKKAFVLRVLFFVVFLDFLGTMMMIPVGQDIYLDHTDPAFASYLLEASQAPTPVEAYLEKDFGKFGPDLKDWGLTIQTAVLLGPAVVGIGQFVSGLGIGHLANSRIGKKGSLLVFTFGGAAVFLVNFFAKEWGLAAFFAVRFFTGLFGGSRPIVNMYIAELYENPMERMQKMAATTTVMIAALSLGPVIGGVFISILGLFGPLLGAAILEFIGGIFVVLYIPAVSSQSGPAKGAAAAPPAEQKAGWKQWVYILWLGRFLDNTAGGFLVHFQTAATKEYVLLQNKSLFSIVMAVVSCSVWFSIKASMRMGPKYGLAWSGFIGQVGTAVAYLVVSFAPTCPGGELACGGVFAYLIPLLFIAFFNPIAGMGIAPTMLQFVPKDQTNVWLGYQAAVVALLRAGCGLILVLPGFLTNEEGMGGEDLYPRGFFMWLNAGFALLSCGPYYLLTKKLPMPAPKKVVPLEETEALELFKKTGDYKWLTMEQMHDINLARLRNGEAPLASDFGTFQDDKDHLARIREMAPKDFGFATSIFGKYIHGWRNGGDDHKEGIREVLRTYAKSPNASWSEEDKNKFGRWFADYCEYAGMSSPSGNPRTWKAIMMATVPVIMEGGLAAAAGSPDDPTGFFANPVPTWIKLDHFYNNFRHLERLNKLNAQKLAFLPTAAMRLPGMG